MSIQLLKSAKLSALVALLLVVSFSADRSAAALRRVMVVHVNSEPSIVGESGLQDRIMTEFSRGNFFQVVGSNVGNGTLPFPSDTYDLDSLRNWGAELGGRYLMLVDVYRQAIERKKTFNVPLIIHKYQTVGVIEGELRLLDISRGKMLLAEPFCVETKGPRIIQAYFDDNRYDADISIPATHKSAFFRQMEAKTAEHFRKRLRTVTNGK